MIQQFMVKYILIHIRPYSQWQGYSYQQKKQFHYVVTATGKVIPLKPLNRSDGSIEVVFVGSKVYANHSTGLLSLLLDLWMQHSEAKIIFVDDLDNQTRNYLTNATCWLLQHMPDWVQQRIFNFNTLLTIRSLLPLI